MYKRYLEPESIHGGNLPTRYILKKIKRAENVISHAQFEKIHTMPIDVIEAVVGDVPSDSRVVVGMSDSDKVQQENAYENNQGNDLVAEADLSVENDIESDNCFDSITDELIHPNLDCKVLDAVLMILHFFLEHRLTWVALEDLLNLFFCILGSSSRLPKTKYFFKKCFGVDDGAVFHFYCKNCDLYFGTYEDVNEMTDEENSDNDNQKLKYKFKKCQNCDQVFSLNKLNDGYFFIQLRIKPQIEKKLKCDPSILDFNTDPNVNDCITDIFDGDLYKSLKAKTSNYKLLTLTLNTDGVRVFKSKRKSSLWPIQLFLNEVPLNKRFKQENIILSGISFGKDPDFNVYMRPLVQEMRTIDQDKIKVDHNHLNKEIALRVLLASADSPARCKMMKLKQYNGGYGCTFCLHPGETFGDSNMSKYITSKEKYPMRTHSSTVKLMKEFLETGEGRYGIVGVSPLIGLPDFDLIRGNVVDYMHAVLLGVVYLLCSLWFDSENHFEKYYVTPRGKELVDKNIKCLQPPRFFTRQPRIIDDIEYWKASEFRNWLLYYAIPCLKNSLQEQYLRHFSLLSEAIFLLLKTEISTADFETASKNLKEFVDQFESYYGKRNMMYNVHLLEHLPKCVKDCGPLWAYSNFNFESSNGFLVKNVRGTTNVEHQLAEKYFLKNALSEFEKKTTNESVLSYIDKTSNKRVKNFKKIDNITLFGKPRKHSLNDHEKFLLKQTKMPSYNKFYCRNEVYYSAKFKRSKRRNDTGIRMKDGTYGEILLIFERNETVFLILRKLQISPVVDVPIHLKKVLSEIADEYLIVRAEDVSEKCVFVRTQKELYISQFPNRFEID